MTPAELDAIEDDIEMAERSVEMAKHVALDHAAALVAEVRKLEHVRALLAQMGGEVHTYARPDASDDYWAGARQAELFWRVKLRLALNPGKSLAPNEV